MRWLTTVEMRHNASFFFAKFAALLMNGNYILTNKEVLNMSGKVRLLVVICGLLTFGPVGALAAYLITKFIDDKTK